MPDHLDDAGRSTHLNDGQPAHTPRVRVRDVNRTLATAGLAPLPDDAPRFTVGLRTAQMLDAVLVLCGAPGAAQATALRDQARRALREGGFMVKDANGVPGMVYVIGRQ